MKPQPCATAALPPSWHAYPRGNSLAAAGGVGAEEAEEKVCRRMTPARAPATSPAETLSAPGSQVPAAPAMLPRLVLRPPSPAPLRRDQRSQGLACPRPPPGTVGYGGRSHTSAAPGIGAIPLPFPRPADPNDSRARRPAPHRQNYVGGYVFAQRLSGPAEEPPDACGSQSRTPHAPLHSQPCWRCARSSFCDELAQGYRWENASPRIPPRNPAKGNEVAPFRPICPRNRIDS